MKAFQTLSILSASPAWHCAALSRQCPLTFLPTSWPQCPIPTHSLPPSSSPSTKRPYSTRPSSQPTPALATGTFSYRVAASFSGKGRRFNPRTDSYSYSSDLQLLEGPFTGRPSSGQDAFFISRVGTSSRIAFGVADGVGGWSDSGFDSAHFSHGLCQAMARNAETTMDEQKARTLRPTDLLKRAYEGIVADKVIEGGGSTACLAIGGEEGNVSVANLGDSGFVQLRLNAVNYYSNPQTHAFNTPYQLSIVPPRILALSRVFGGGPLHDMPKDASVTQHEVRHGDVLVFATDGVWDNLSPQDLLRIVSRQMMGFRAWVDGDKGVEVSDSIQDLSRDGGIALQKAENSLQAHLAVHIVGEAKTASQDAKRDGPFAKEIQKHYPEEDWHGGKVDDICVVVAIVVDESANAG